MPYPILSLDAPAPELLRSRQGRCALAIMAKAPRAGKVKTRLSPDFTPGQAAELAAAAISDTFAAVADLPFSRRILSFDGDLLPAGSESFEVIPQIAGDLDARLGAIFDECEGPTVLIGMDTPQVAADDLRATAGRWRDDIDAWFGPASDGGFWALGLADPDGDLVRGVPMSRDDTGEIQLARLRRAGLRVESLPTLTDVDTITEAREVAALAPRTRFAERFREFTMDQTIAQLVAPLRAGSGS